MGANASIHASTPQTVVACAYLRCSIKRARCTIVENAVTGSVRTITYRGTRFLAICGFSQASLYLSLVGAFSSGASCGIRTRSSTRADAVDSVLRTRDRTGDWLANTLVEDAPVVIVAFCLIRNGCADIDHRLGQRAGIEAAIVLAGAQCRRCWSRHTLSPLEDSIR